MCGCVRTPERREERTCLLFCAFFFSPRGHTHEMQNNAPEPPVVFVNPTGTAWTFIFRLVRANDAGGQN